MSTANLGRVGFVNKGTWSDGVHKINDLVTYGTAKYACITPHTSTLGDISPTNISYWEKWTDYGIHSVTNTSNNAVSSADTQYLNYFSGTSTGALSIKITGLVTATASTVDLGFMEITVIQDDRDHSSATNPASYKFMIKGNMDTGVWYNTQAVLLGTNALTPINVRFTRTTSDAYIEIGETTSTWYYTTVEVSHVSSYIISGFSPIFIASIQNSLLGTTTDSIISAIPNSTKNENTLQTSIASASTCTIGTYLAGDTLHITGNTTITSLGVSINGTIRNVIFDGILILTHNATSLNLPTSANITTAVGDTATFICNNGASGYWTCLDYYRKDGTSLVLPVSPNIITPNINAISYKATPVSITAWSYTGTTTTTITLTVASHTFIVGDWINVNGLTTSTAVSTANNYIIPNGIYTVTAFTGTTIQYQITTPSALTLTPTVSSATVIGQTAVNGVVGGLGVGQTVKDMTTQRASGVVYYNTTGRPIFINVVHSAVASVSVYISMDGIAFVAIGTASSVSQVNTSFTVPTGFSYKILNFVTIVELR